jgi:hypothetical protein
MLQAAAHHARLSGIAGRMFGEPLDDTGHVLLEVARDGKVQHTRTRFTSVLEVVRDTTWHEDEANLRGIKPLVGHQKLIAPSMTQNTSSSRCE